MGMFPRKHNRVGLALFFKSRPPASGDHVQELGAQLSALEPQARLASALAGMESHFYSMDTSNEATVEAWIKKHSKEYMALKAQASTLDESPHRLPDLLGKCDVLLKDMQRVATEHASRKLQNLLTLLEAKVTEAGAWKEGLQRQATWKTAREKLAPVIASGGPAEKLSSAMRKAEEMFKDAFLLKDKFTVTLPDEQLSECKKLLASGAVLLAESTLMSIMEDESLSADGKRSRLQKCFTKVSTQSRDFSSDIKKELLPAIVSNTVGKLLS